MPTPSTVLVVLIHHQYGTNTAVCRTPAAADRVLAEYAAEWWESEFGPHVPRPTARQALIERYFEKVEETESFEILEATIHE